MSGSSRTVALVGAAGKTSRAVRQALVERGVGEGEIRPLVRRPSTDQRAVVVDLLDRSSVERALEGVDVVHHLAPNLHSHEVAIAENVVSAASRQGVRRMVFHSVLRPGIEQMPHHWAKLRAEELLWSSRLEVTVLQPSAYAQNLVPPAAAGRLRVPYSLDAPFSLVDLADVATVTVKALLDDGHVGATYELAGPVTTIRALAGELDVPAERTDPQVWLASHASAMPAYAREALIKMYRWYDVHGLAGSPAVLRWLLGRAPTPALEVLRRARRG